MADCIFCSPEKIRQDILHETANFFVKVGFGLYSAGHVMVIPKKHLDCYACLPNCLEQEYDSLRYLVNSKISGAFSRPFQIEMGVWGQSIRHAHVHFVPSESKEYKIDNLVHELVLSGPEKIDVEQADRSRVKEIYRQEGGYVWIEDKGLTYVCHIKGLSFDPQNPHPQLTLRPFFSSIGVKGVSSWRDLTGEDQKRDNQKRDLTKKLLNF